MKHMADEEECDCFGTMYTDKEGRRYCTLCKKRCDSE